MTSVQGQFNMFEPPKRAPNPFEAYGEEATVAPVRSRLKGIETRRKNKEAERIEAAVDETAVRLKIYRAWIKERHEKLFAGPVGAQAKSLHTFLKQMTLTCAPALLAFIEQAAWLKTADADTKYEVLCMVSHAISRLRLSAGLTPFDDPLPGEPDNAFLIIREVLK